MQIRKYCAGHDKQCYISLPHSHNGTVSVCISYHMSQKMLIVGGFFVSFCFIQQVVQMINAGLEYYCLNYNEILVTKLFAFGSNGC